MTRSFGKTIVIGLGGSIIYPETIDVTFLKKLRTLILAEVGKGREIVLVVGGGRICRIYQEAAGKIVQVADEDKDWIGIHATRTNAHLLRTIFRKEADPVVFDARGKRTKLGYPITIASGWRPGWSTDYVAVQIAADLGVPEVIVWGKPAHVFNKDPAKYKNARPFLEIGWKPYRKLIPAKWKPGAHAPVDPVAARLAEREGIACIIIGREISNVKKLLSGKPFAGTVIQNQ